MVAGRHKSRSSRRIHVKTPGGINKILYKPRKPSAAVCSVTRQRLLGVPKLLPFKLRKLSITQRRPTRPYGGNLSSMAMRDVMKQKIESIKVGSPFKGDVLAPGRLALKIAGRDAGKVCIIIELKDGKVLVDGEVRRRSINPAHICPLKNGVKLSKGDAAEVKKIFSDLGLTYLETKPKKIAEKPTAKPRKSSKKAVKAE